MDNGSKKDGLDEEIKEEKKILEKQKRDNETVHKMNNLKHELSELKNGNFIKRWLYSDYMDELERKIKRIEEKLQGGIIRETPVAQIERLKLHIQYLKNCRNSKCDYVVWGHHPEKLNREVMEKYLERFRKLPEYIHPDIKKVNITMFGGVGVGKSSYLNTVVTALNNTEDEGVVKDFLSSPSKTGRSKTRTFQLDKMKLENKRSLPINFYDCPGINADEDERMNLQVLEAVIKGHVRGNVQFDSNEIQNESQTHYRQRPEPKDEMHCIIFVIKATTHLDPGNAALGKIRKIQRKFNGPGDFRQFAFVTAVDRIGVPDIDMEEVFKYKSVKDICQKVAELLEIDMHSVHPVSNYFEENEPTVAKNTLSLMALWDVVQCGKRHIERKMEACLESD